jgi:hypothetical protein
MQFHEASANEVRAFEMKFDEDFHQTVTLPSTDFDTAIRYMFMWAEDLQRFPLLALREMGASVYPEFVRACDDAKYQMKDALPLLSRLAAHEGSPSVDFDMQAYGLVQKLLGSCNRYQPARSALASFYAGQASARIDEAGTVLKVSPTHGSDRYDALDGILQMSGAEGPLERIARWFLSEEPPELPFKIAEKVKSVSPRALTYDFDERLATSLWKELPRSGQLIPSAWASPKWGTATEIRDTLHGLQTVCAYHLLAITLGALVHQTEAAGRLDSCLETSQSELLRRAEAAAGKKLSKRILEALVYGTDVKNPDPALQPLVRLANGSVITSPLLVLSSFVERNFLTLLARLDSPSFDLASHAFESAMVDRIRDSLSKHPWLCRFQFTGGVPSETGDIDTLIVDPSSKTVLVGELRFMLPAGDSREVMRRHEESKKKVLQARRKGESVRTHLNAVLDAVGVPVPARKGRWNVQEMVIIDGFCGMSTEEVPVVPEKLFQSEVRAHHSLKNLVSYLRSHEWLPKRSRDYERKTVSITFGTQTLESPMIAMSNDALYRLQPK